MVAAIRRYLDERGFVEVETPVLQPRYGGAFARPFVTHHNELDADLYLRIATELYLKRLIVGGLEKVYEIGKDFRNEGISYKHQPEFTMLEWYEAYADYRDTMARIEDLVADRRPRDARDDAGDLPRSRGRSEGAVAARAARRTHSRSTGSGRATRRSCGRVLEDRRDDTARTRTWAQLVDHALSSFVEPTLIEPTILHDYPVELSPFARATDDDPTLVERFEYYVGGMELGNAFTEINDAAEQAERFRAAGGGEGGRRRPRRGGRPRLRRGALLRHAADGRHRPRHRPPGDGADRAARRSATSCCSRRCATPIAERSGRRPS